MFLVFLGEECCAICGKHPVIDIDCCEYPHRCADGVMRWTDGSIVRELENQSTKTKVGEKPKLVNQF